MYLSIYLSVLLVFSFQTTIWSLDTAGVLPSPPAVTDCLQTLLVGLAWQWWCMKLS